jgi:hypothetical protein
MLFLLSLRILACLLVLSWFYCAAFNAVVAWRAVVQRQFRPEPIRLAGGLCAALALLLWSRSNVRGTYVGLCFFPDYSPMRFLWLLLLLDCGTVPTPTLIVSGMHVLRRVSRAASGRR